MRSPNPWIAVPTIAAALAGGVVGYIIAEASCAPRSCVPAAVAVGLGVGVAVAVGVAVVAILAVRSIGEWREHVEREIVIRTDDPTPPDDQGTR